MKTPSVEYLDAMTPLSGAPPVDPKPPAEHVVQFSGGACSFFAAKRVIERYGKDRVVLLFADTKMEDEDLYRFLEDCEAHLGMPIIRIADGRTPWEVFFAERFLGNSRVDPCSKILKRELLWSWLERNAPKATVHVGLDWTEEHRLERLRNYRPGVIIEAPMMWKPIVDKPEMLVKLRKLGIKIPRLYAMGFAHNNCGGFCIKSGQAQFRLLLKTMPERYALHEAQELKLRAYLEKDVAILRDRKGGKSRPLTLEEFRKRIEGGGEHDRHDWGGCGCAID